MDGRTKPPFISNHSDVSPNGRSASQVICCRRSFCFRESNVHTISTKHIQRSFRKCQACCVSSDSLLSTFFARFLFRLFPSGKTPPGVRQSATLSSALNFRFRVHVRTAYIASGLCSTRICRIRPLLARITQMSSFFLLPSRPLFRPIRE